MLTVHPDEVVVPVELVRELVDAQFPQWAELPLERVPTYGTDNVLFRLGDTLQVRLPRLRTEAPPTAVIEQLARDAELLPRLRPQLPVDVPEVVAVAEPAEGYPYPWAVYRWLEGAPPTEGTPALAQELAGFLAALQRIDTTGARAGRDRGGPLALRDRATRAALARLQEEIDVAAAAAAWEAALAAPPWHREQVWLHGDVLEGNLLVQDGRLTAVIDWGCVVAGDPAADYMSAWSLLWPARDAFRAATGVDDATWSRARGVALSQALIALPYYKETNPPVAQRSRRVIANVLADHATLRPEATTTRSEA